MHRPATTARHTTPRKCRRLRPEPESLEGRMLLSAGQLDPTFSGDGYAITQAPAPKNGIPGDRATDVEIQPDGKIVALGYARSASGGFDFEVIRLTNTGNLDPTFGSGGRVLLLKGSPGDMALQADGRIVLVGSVTVTTGKGRNTVQQNDIVVVRLLANGALDTSFGQGGQVITSISTSGDLTDHASSVAIQADGKIVIAGRTTNGTATGIDSVLMRYNTNGSLDTSFGQGGKVVTAWSTGEDAISDIAIQGDGRIVVSGKGYLNSPQNSVNPYFVARYNANGSLDSGAAGDATPADSFGTAGAVVTPFGNTGVVWTPAPLALQPDGAIVIAGRSYDGTNNDLALARFTSTGALDATFGGGSGSVIVGLGGSQISWAVALQGDGKLVLAGYSDATTSSTRETLLARFQPDGSLDAGFGTGGIALNSFSSGPDEFGDVAVQSDGKIVAVGSIDPPTGGAAQPSFLTARFQGDPVATFSASMTLIGRTTSNGRSAATGQPEILVLLNDHNLTELATEVILSRPKRRGALRP